MSAEVVFMMGEYEARFPTDRWYCKNHMWACPRSESNSSQDGGAVGQSVHLRFGLSAYAVRLLQDVYFLDMTIEPGMHLEARQEIGSIESKKAESSLYSPTAGQVTAINEELIQDPTAINLDKYGAGWMFELHGHLDQLLKPDQYLEHLDAAWEIAQRTIKGQANA